MKSKRVLLLPILLATLGAAGIVSVFTFDGIGIKGGSGNFSKVYEALSVAVFVISLVATWYSTILICFKLVSVDRQRRHLQEGSASRYGRIVRVLIQSGTLYSLTLGAWLICILAEGVSGFISLVILSDLSETLIFGSSA